MNGWMKERKLGRRGLSLMPYCHRWCWKTYMAGSTPRLLSTTTKQATRDPQQPGNSRCRPANRLGRFSLANLEFIRALRRRCGFPSPSYLTTRKTYFLSSLPTLSYLHLTHRHRNLPFPLRLPILSSSLISSSVQARHLGQSLQLRAFNPSFDGSFACFWCTSC